MILRHLFSARVALFSSTLTIAFIIAGCGGSGSLGGSVVPFPPAIYVSRSSPGNVVSFTDMTGAGWLERSTPGYPGSIAFDQSGRMIVALYFDSILVRYDGTMAEQTLGSIGSGVKQFDKPTDIAIDSHGRIYIADSENRRLVRMNNFSGSGWTTLDLSAYLPDEQSIYSPSFSVAVDELDQIYILPVATDVLTRFLSMTDSSPVSYGSTGSGQGQFQTPSCVTIGPDAKIYIADRFNSRIVRIDDMTGAGWTTYGTSGSGVGQFELPSEVDFDNLGRMYILDRNNKRVVRMNDMSGTGWVSYGTDNTAGGGTGPWPESLQVLN